jgi:hypothetical protein
VCYGIILVRYRKSSSESPLPSLCLASPLFLIAWVGKWVITIVAAFFSVSRDGMRAARARIDRQRAELGLPPLNRRRELVLNLSRSWRMLRHPTRERAFIAESFRALKNLAIS